MRSQYAKCVSKAVIFLSVLLALVTGIAPLVQAASPAIKPEISELKIGVPDLDPSFLPNWAAEQRGFFKEEGISDVKVLVFKGNGPTVQALSGGTIDLCVASLIGLVNTINAGQKFKAFWAGYNMTDWAWYGQAKYKSIAETKGGRYGISRFGSLTDFMTRYALRSGGLDPEKDVNILQLGGQAEFMAAMSSGQLDVAILSAPYTYMAAEKGYVKLMSQKDFAADYPTHVIYTKEEWIGKNPNTIRAYLRATTRAMEWIKANPEEAANLVTKQLKFKIEHARKAIDDLKDGWYPDGRLPQDGMKVFWTIATQSGEVKEPWPNSKWLDDRFLKTQDQWRK
jgi:NitT/TauT family transport system substrate-binding protein